MNNKCCVVACCMFIIFSFSFSMCRTPDFRCLYARLVQPFYYTDSCRRRCRHYSPYHHQHHHHHRRNKHRSLCNFSMPMWPTRTFPAEIQRLLALLMQHVLVNRELYLAISVAGNSTNANFARKNVSGFWFYYESSSKLLLAAPNI